ncbi:MAG: hypothetical protein UU13_C0011G0006 [Candidatus Nomurabacteria bacterium GW2011_GWB1_40_7]|uniref:Uncharacterized protein n=1 Tax=Candidatus Nomurabacteria bacterium GW2011_GWB1_40_7 TaxID=1618744 RepID=A0A0G0SZH9_9BACT|nr:MAG: hypothetical protein UU13_C0011G0006 [Candidatus Nomurabacteria bacterium GW2011_GWB1_40_7]
MQEKYQPTEGEKGEINRSPNNSVSDRDKIVREVPYEGLKNYFRRVITTTAKNAGHEVIDFLEPLDGGFEARLRKPNGEFLLIEGTGGAQEYGLYPDEYVTPDFFTRAEIDGVKRFYEERHKPLSKEESILYSLSPEARDGMRYAPYNSVLRLISQLDIKSAEELAKIIKKQEPNDYGKRIFADLKEDVAARNQFIEDALKREKLERENNL